MKRYVIILLSLSVVLTGCSTKPSQTTSFEQAVTIFSDNIQNIQQTTKILGLTGNKSINLFLETHGESQDFKLNLDFSLSGFVDHKDKAAELDGSVNLTFRDKNEQEENIISGSISTISTNNIFYFLINDSFINIGTGNYQGDLLYLISKNIEHKRISIVQPQDSNLKNINTDINFLLDTLSNPDAFKLIEEVYYEGDLAYKVELASNILQINSFKGLFIVHSASDIELKLENADISLGNQNYFIKGSISSADGNLNIQNTNLPSKIIKLSWESTRKSTSLVVSNLLDGHEIIKLDLKLSPKKTEDKTTIQINGILNISPLIIYGSDLEKNIQIDINGQYVFRGIEKVLIEAPDSYVLGEQILGDQFSLETILSSND